MPIRKALIYATSSKGLLVFDEPQYPHVPIQVPGGTVEADEEVQRAARREFHEETGIDGTFEFHLLSTVDHKYTRDGIVTTLQRSYFQVALPDGLSDTWYHEETKPDGGGAPILFRFFWIPLSKARQRLGLGMGECLDYALLWRRQA